MGELFQLHRPHPNSRAALLSLFKISIIFIIASKNDCNFVNNIIAPYLVPDAKYDISNARIVFISYYSIIREIYRGHDVFKQLLK